MYTQINHLLNNNEQRIVLLGGLPGSGKSTLSKYFEEAGYVIICPDTFRGIVSKTIPGREAWTDAQHEGDQSVSGEAWKMAYDESHKALRAGKSIVFDAMLHTAKARRGTKGELVRHKLPFYAIYMDVTLETAKKRNEERGAKGGRQVPDFVLKSKWRQQAFPMVEEGFKEVHYISNDLVIKPMAEELKESILEALVKNPRATIESMRVTGVLKNVFPSLDECWGFAQDNKHHDFPLHEHMIGAAELIENRSPVAVVSALLHDVGKRKTKEYFAKVKEGHDRFKAGDKFTLLKRMELGASFEKIGWNGVTQAFFAYDEVVIDENAHYYDHENVGAIEARRDLLAAGFSEEFANEVYGYILYHMELPYREASEGHLRKLIQKVGQHRIQTLLDIRKADKSSGSSKDGVLDFHQMTTNMVHDILKKIS